MIGKLARPRNRCRSECHHGCLHVGVAVYAAEGLPALAPPPPGEQRLIEGDELLAAHSAEIDSAHRVPRRRKLAQVPSP
jgi:hypothetical protein